MGSHDKFEQLDILIVGAGIAGLTAAIALKHAGHNVTIFESSKLLHEVGAAITLSPNGTRVLSKLGFDFKAARGVPIDTVAVYSGTTLEDLQFVPPGSMDGLEKVLGYPYRAFHRVDLHNELKRVALLHDGTGPNVDLHLGVRIVKVDVEAAEIELDDGRVWKGDLLIGADGLHSVVKSAALGADFEDGVEIEDAGWDIYRWLLNTKDVEEDEGLKALMRKTRSSFVLPFRGKTLRIIWYSCRNGEVQNLAAFCPRKQGEQGSEDYNLAASKETVLEIFSAYHPTLLRLVKKADTIKTWHLRNRTPLGSLIYGKTILIGDAGHPMLPFNAQGGNQALEDGGALLALFSNLRSKDEIPERMKMFNLARRKRACRQQILSSVPSEEVKNLGDKLNGYEDETAVKHVESETPRDKTLRDLGYNIFERCEQLLNNAS